ncbi:2-oxoacid:acceptor oxidoreductase subunit alpha [Candidatus Parcubacteria bacterium]|nr:2-oxoacid:acceptor oxidoreductase subunit alpha [Candidatus Parcubacteria bacterium]
MNQEFTILIGGQAGQGTRFGGSLLAKIFNELGYFVYVYEDYQSLIRGGHNFSEIRVSQREIAARKEKLNFILALDENTINLHKKRLSKKGILIFNQDKVKNQKGGFGILADTIVKKEGGIPVMVNIALISAFSKIVGIEWEFLEEILKRELKKQTELNLKIAKIAFDSQKPVFKIEKTKKAPSLLLTGNEACALGMQRAGLNFYFAYPMTPSTSILNFLAQKEDEFGIKVVQPENEIAVINMALGAAFAGKRSAVGTSGGGFALMTEALSLAGQAEIPILIVESQRAGPSTGMPTYNLQGDLNFVIGAGHGDMVKMVVAPANATEALIWAAKSLNFAWQYQIPVILLLDKDISENTFSVPKNILEKIKIKPPKLWQKGEYKRYKIERDGVSPLAFPGTENVVVKACSYEHDEYGITSDEEKIVKAMIEKRKRKLAKIKKDLEKEETIKISGKKSSKVVLISWGISSGPAKEIAEKFGFKFLQPIVLYPFPKEKMKKEILGAKKIICLEMNSLGQLANFLRGNEIKVDFEILKYTGRPFFVEEIEREIKKLKI